MPNPFPGMNPYLESPELWHQVDNRLIVSIADEITPQVAPNYRVSIEERVYTSMEDLMLVGIADVAVARRDLRDSSPTSATSVLAQPIRVRVPMPEEIVERFLEVKSTQTGVVVCVIEVLSPKNKRDKDGRATYASKRLKILGSATSLVEIDLLRSGDSMPVLGGTSDHINSVYRILVSRGSCRPDADLFAFGLQDRIPSFPIPLLANDPEPSVDLQTLLNQIYDRARFDLAIDYSKPVKPALPPEEARATAHISYQKSK